MSRAAASNDGVLAPLEVVIRLRDALRAGEQLEAAVRGPLIESLDRYLWGDVDLEAALGLDRKPGRRDPRNEWKLLQRNAHLRTAAELLPRRETSAGKARALATKFARYYTSGWMHERGLEECPPHRLGTMQEFFWRALKAWDRPLTEHTIRKILISK